MIHNFIFLNIKHCFYYFLGDDRDDICNSLSCPQARNVDGYFYFCVLKENFRSPITCELLNETNCPDETFGSWMGYPCLENGDKGTSLCHAFAKKEKVVFLSVKAETDCKDSGTFLFYTVVIFYCI